MQAKSLEAKKSYMQIIKKDILTKWFWYGYVIETTFTNPFRPF